MPSIPATLARVIKVTNKPDATAEEVARVVMLDQSLATKVLRLANSAYLGRLKKAETVTEAVVTLGLSAVRNLAASASVVDALFPSQLFPGFSWQDMWVHSVTCGLAAEAIYVRIAGRGSSESAFVAGLLHDVGKLVLARALPHKFVQIIGACHNYGYEMLQAETAILATSHSKIGGELAQQWQFPNKLIAGIAFHHSPESSTDYEDMARAVQAANMLAKRMGRNYLVGVRADISLKDIAECAGLSQSDIDYVVDQVRQGLRNSTEILSWGDRMPKSGTAMAA